jgi:hypothetical protein
VDGGERRQSGAAPRGRGRCGGPDPPGEPQSGEAMGPLGLVPSSGAIADRGAGATLPRRELHHPMIVDTHDSNDDHAYWLLQGPDDPVRDSPAKLPYPPGVKAGSLPFTLDNPLSHAPN